MKRKLLNKLMGVVLTASMAFGLVACGSQETGQNTTETSKSNQESAVVSEKTSEPEEVGVTYPLETEDTLTIWCANQLKPSSEYLSWKESPFHTGLEKKTGVTVEWKYPTEGSAVKEAYNLLLLDEVLPDMIFNQYGSADGAELLDNGIALDLTEYLPKYAPDFWEYINRPENYKELKDITTEDGKFFCIPGLRESMYNITYVGPIIRQDWLDECKLDTPVTMEDWENVLVTFKEKYGAMFSCRLTMFSVAGLGSGTGAYGTHTPTFFIDDNGKVQYGPTQPEWKEYMETLSRWYQMGLIDPDFLTVDNTTLRAKALNGTVGVSITPMSLLTMIVEDAEAEGNGAEWAGLSYPRTAEGEPTNYIQAAASRYSGYAVVVTSSCPEEKIKTVLNWLNYGYTEEGMMYWNYGEEGITYTLDADGNPQWTDLILNDPLGINGAVEKYVGCYGAAPAMQLANLVAMKNSEVAAEAVYVWTENTEVEKHYAPSTPYTDDEEARYYDLYTPINTYVSECALKFITGDKPMEEYDAFIAELEKMKIGECLEIRQAAYDRYMAR